MELDLMRAFSGGGKLAAEVKTSCNEFVVGIKDVGQRYRERQADCNMFWEMMNTCGGFFWRKDSESRYLFANRDYYSLILFPDSEDVPDTAIQLVQQVGGLTDEDLFTGYTVRTGRVHTFAQTTKEADAYVIQKGKGCSFFEVGLIGEDPVALKTIRRPLFDADGNLEGIVGTAMDLSIWGDDIFERIEMWRGGQNVKNMGCGLYMLNDGPMARERSSALKDFILGEAWKIAG